MLMVARTDIIPITRRNRDARNRRADPLLANRAICSVRKSRQPAEEIAVEM